MLRATFPLCAVVVRQHSAKDSEPSCKFECDYRDCI